MRSRSAFVSLVVLAAAFAWSAAGEPAPILTPVPAGAAGAATAHDPYVNASPVVTEAPAERKPCTFYNSDCAGGYTGQTCAPVPGFCECWVNGSSYACLSLG
ncbi:MAG TPA: hypothetical protein VJV23_06915 [Candidatus Polarisedimenticolia bacterium]|nr:hypothetical protein [Candidatus Polarisedimenticolia bacterium]